MEMKETSATRRRARQADRAKETLGRAEEVRGALERIAHPLGFRDRQTGKPLSAWEWIVWTRDRGTLTQQLRAARMVSLELGKVGRS